MATFYADTGSFELLSVTNLTATTSSILYVTASTLDIGTNIISVNVGSPQRFGGLAVIDSGSGTPYRSGSILFDSQNNQWIFVHQTTAGGAVTSSVFIQGPQTFNNVGNETTLTTNRVPKATGGDLGEHIGDSNITDTGTVIKLNSNSEVTGSLNVSAGITGSLLGTASFASLANVNISAGANTANVSQLVFSSANNVTFGINAGTITAAASINVSAGTTSNNVSQLIFSNANNHTFGLNSNSVSVSYQPPYQSYFENIPVVVGTINSVFSLGGSSNHVQPFVLPYDISVSYMRFLMTNSIASTTYATTANTTVALTNAMTWWANIYSAGAGANSLSLQYVTGGSAGMTYQVRGLIGAASNNQTVSQSISFAALGANTQNSSTAYNINSATQNISTTWMTFINAARFLDLPFAASLPAGEYWMAVQKSSATTTSGLNIGNATMNNTLYHVSQVNISFAVPGNASNQATDQIQPGLGYWSTNVLGSTSNSLAITLISSIANQPRIPFQMHRFA